MPITQLIPALTERNVRLSADNGQLVASNAAGRIDDLAPSIQHHKAALVRRFGPEPPAVYRHALAAAVTWQDLEALLTAIQADFTGGWLSQAAVEAFAQQVKARARWLRSADDQVWNKDLMRQINTAIDRRKAALAAGEAIPHDGFFDTLNEELRPGQVVERLDRPEEGPLVLRFQTAFGTWVYAHLDRPDDVGFEVGGQALRLRDTNARPKSAQKGRAGV